MFTTLITFFLTVLGALRASPLYSHILSLGDGLRVTDRSWFSPVVSLPLLEKTATSLGTQTGNGTLNLVFFGSPLILTLPSSPTLLSLPSLPLLLTLPAATRIRSSLYPELVLLLAYLSGFLIVLGGLFWHLRATLVTTCETCDDCESQIRDGVTVLTFGLAYSGGAYTASELVGILDTSAAPALAIIREPKSKKAKTASTTTAVSATTAKAATPPPTSQETIAATLRASAPLAPLVSEEDQGGAWQTWTNNRKRRPPRRPPPPSALRAFPSRSTSVLSASRTSDTLFSSISSTSTTPTSVALSRRPSIAKSPSPHKPTPSPSPSTVRIRTHDTDTPTIAIASYNKFSVLEVYEVAE
ncbi:hypothetical protein OH77DRAFT_1586827 [Trametes cingulata]|nr:hypothetical protein OH77DRAFT_1586827 [Trametes cingulata]